MLLHSCHDALNVRLAMPSSVDERGLCLLLDTDSVTVLNDVSPLDTDSVTVLNDVSPLDTDSGTVLNDVSPLDTDCAAVQNDVSPLDANGYQPCLPGRGCTSFCSEKGEGVRLARV